MAVPKILVVDDDAELRKMMAYFLSNNGFMVYTASTGEEIKSHVPSTFKPLGGAAVWELARRETASRNERRGNVPVPMCSRLHRPDLTKPCLCPRSSGVE